MNFAIAGNNPKTLVNIVTHGHQLVSKMAMFTDELNKSKVFPAAYTT